MAWFADLAGKAESLLNNLDEQTGAALRNHNNLLKQNKHERPEIIHPESSVGQKKRPIPRNLRKVSAVVDSRLNNVSNRKLSPPSPYHPQSPTKNNPECIRYPSPKTRHSPLSKPQYTLSHCPKTLVGDFREDTDNNQFGLRQRRYSLPSDLEQINNENLIYKMQNLEVENVMLKNELNVISSEVSDLLDRLQRTEDGNTLVNCNKELITTQTKLENSQLLNEKSEFDKNTLSTHLNQLKSKINELTNVEIAKYKVQNETWELELAAMSNRNKELEEEVHQLTEKVQDNASAHIKLENELRHAQSTISELQSNLERSTAECQRLEKDWETYKLRVKSMLYAKDNEITALKQGTCVNEDTKMLIEQMDSLKKERDELSESIVSVRGECVSLQQQTKQLEAQLAEAGRAVAALRDALRDERAARGRAEAQARARIKEIKTIEIETGQTIASLQTALREKESELNHLRDSTSSVQTTDTSALNVGDYDVSQSTIDNDKIHYLTNTLIQKQGRIDSLIADNNMLKIQLDKLQSKYKSELSVYKTNAHSVVHLQDDSRLRSRNESTSPVEKLSVRMGLILRRNPLFRVFIVIYMIGLHFWVLTVLLTSTPEGYITRSSKS